MYNFNFNTKQVTCIFDDIKFVVNNSTTLTIECSKKEASVVKLFDKLFVGLPIEKLGTIKCITMNSDTCGYFYINSSKHFFSIHEKIMYIRKRS